MGRNINNKEGIQSFVKFAQQSPRNRKRALAQAGRLVNALASKRKLTKNDLENIAGGLGPEIRRIVE